MKPLERFRGRRGGSSAPDAGVAHALKPSVPGCGRERDDRIHFPEG